MNVLQRQLIAARRRPAALATLRPRVRAVVDAAQALRVHVAVDLRRRERRVAEELLDHAQVGAALEQVRREGVAQAVRVAEEPAHGARVEPAAARRQEERVVRARARARAARRAGSARAWCAASSPSGTTRSLPPLPCTWTSSRSKSTSREVERRRPPRCGARRSTGARGARGCGARGPSRPRPRSRIASISGSFGASGRPARAAGRERGVGDALRAEREAEARAHRCESARDRGGGEPVVTAARARRPSRRARARRRRRASARARRASARTPARSLAVRALRRVGERPVLEEAVDRRGACPHGRRSAPGASEPACARRGRSCRAREARCLRGSTGSASPRRASTRPTTAKTAIVARSETRSSSSPATSGPSGAMMSAIVRPHALDAAEEAVGRHRELVAAHDRVGRRDRERGRDDARRRARRRSARPGRAPQPVHVQSSSTRTPRTGSAPPDERRQERRRAARRRRTRESRSPTCAARQALRPRRSRRSRAARPARRSSRARTGSAVVRRNGWCQRKRKPSASRVRSGDAVGLALLLERRAHREQRDRRERVRAPRGRRTGARARRRTARRRAAGRRAHRGLAAGDDGDRRGELRASGRPRGALPSARRRRRPRRRPRRTRRPGSSRDDLVERRRARRGSPIATRADGVRADHQPPAVPAVGGEPGGEREERHREQPDERDDARPSPPSR